jgi:hypothetical protein
MSPVVGLESLPDLVHNKLRFRCEFNSFKNEFCLNIKTDSSANTSAGGSFWHFFLKALVMIQLTSHTYTFIILIKTEKKMNLKKITKLFITLLVFLTATFFTACKNEPENNPFVETAWFSSFPTDSYIIFVSSSKYKFFKTDSEKFYTVKKQGESYIASLHSGPTSKSEITQTFTMDNEDSKNGTLRIFSKPGFTNLYAKLKSLPED